MIWGRFPWYGHRLAYRHLAYLTFEPGAGKSLPTLCAGQPDALASVWTLPVLIDGRQEQVRFDLASDPPTITASFGVVKSFGPHQHIVY
ncbi:MAG: hypothetical protein JWM57_3330 [Phycisphaerales bacterium]|nr:hypothetical protein [Phycisphaerales bacterium]